MSCAACSTRIERVLNKMEGIQQANVNLATEKAVVEFDDSLVNTERIEEAIRKLGYEIIKEVKQANKVDFKIGGMSCAACSAKIETLMRGDLRSIPTAIKLSR
jgi:P-type Cu+ transporter